MPLLDKAAILAAKDARFEDIEVPEWGGTVRVKVMSAGERDAWEIAHMPDLSGMDARDPNLLEKLKERMDNVRARLLLYTVVDEAGELLFSAEDLAELTKKSSAPVERVYEVAQRINGIGEKAKAAIAKN